MTSFEALYTLSRKLGSGGFGTVYKCYSKETGEPFAVKLFSDERVKRYTFCPSSGREIPDEIALWRGLRHKNVIRYVRHFFEKGMWIVVMEHCSGYKDLFSYINSRENPFNERTVTSILRQTLDAILYCRSKKIDHRDIKDENLLYNPKTKLIKLIDFGSASFVSSSYKKLQGTDIYHPPEFFHSGSYSSTAGIVWAVGSLAFILLNGDNPHPSVEEVKKDTPLTWLNATASSGARRFVRRALRHKAIDRESLSLLERSAWLKI